MNVNKKESDKKLSERAQHVLKVLIEHHIQDGQPVGSHTLARIADLDLSPATIRNIMADLEDLGLVRAPHTSAGRIPTVQGYRFFVDTLLTVERIQEEEVNGLRLALASDKDSQVLIKSASILLSAITRMAGVVTIPRQKHTALRHIEFIPLSEQRVLAILVVNNQEVQNRILSTNRQYTPTELQEIGNYLNQQFRGKNLRVVQATLEKEVKEVQESMNHLIKNAIEIGNEVFVNQNTQHDSGDFVLVGETNLMHFAELSNLEKLRQLFDAFNKKRDILHLLDSCSQAERVQIFIGEESGYEVFDQCSLVSAPYTVSGHIVGVVGVIGPTRMSYERVIPLVDITAKLLGAALNAHH